jgi:hypothetical protein
MEECEGKYVCYNEALNPIEGMEAWDNEGRDTNFERAEIFADARRCAGVISEGE